MRGSVVLYYKGAWWDDSSVWGAGPKAVMQDGGRMGVLLLTDQMAEPEKV